MTGPSNPPPPGGPGRMVAPLTDAQRVTRYLDQTGSWNLTPRQRRRADHKLRRAQKRVWA